MGRRGTKGIYVVGGGGIVGKRGEGEEGGGKEVDKRD